ncbi:ADP-ribosylation/Crystallin J1 [Sphaerosporella brunnea]|uniref:ADP-ribosylhydrolase ARH3 n=1 Tax=Sphaerosporella brunnea TaxID=1250544 RepID=A0A5J5EXB1_9PEZI|nr:ADP-ribosylation/Crystallin J1 [Sphaerosporella brunnea]
MPAGPVAAKIRTSLLCLAICDALGGPAEFQPRGSFPLITSMQANRNFRLPPGAWTDDTSMTLLLIDSLSSTRTFSEADQAARYLRWLTTGYLSVTGVCFDAGNATRMAVGIWASGGGLDDVRKALDKKACCGNGSLMRVLAVALVFWAEAAETGCELARRSSAVTHPHRVCQEACALYVLLVSTILRCAAARTSVTKADLLQLLRDWEYETTELGAIFGVENWIDKEEIDIQSTGYVVYSLEAALWVFFGTDSFVEGAVKVVNLGDDADTVGAIYGGIAGAWYGGGDAFWEGKAKEWKEDLLKCDVVEAFAEKVVRIAT